jgi:hypothetical protein
MPAFIFDPRQLILTHVSIPQLPQRVRQDLGRCTLLSELSELWNICAQYYFDQQYPRVAL